MKTLPSPHTHISRGGGRRGEYLNDTSVPFQSRVLKTLVLYQCKEICSIFPFYANIWLSLFYFLANRIWACFISSLKLHIFFLPHISMSLLHCTNLTVQIVWLLQHFFFRCHLRQHANRILCSGMWQKLVWFSALSAAVDHLMMLAQADK